MHICVTRVQGFFSPVVPRVVKTSVFMRISAWTAHLDNARTGQAVPFSRLNRSVKNTSMSHKTGNINRLFRLFHLVPELFQTKNIDFMSVWSNSGTTEQELLYRLNFIFIYISIRCVCVCVTRVQGFLCSLVPQMPKKRLKSRSLGGTTLWNKCEQVEQPRKGKKL